MTTLPPARPKNPYWSELRTVLFYSTVRTNLPT